MSEMLKIRFEPMGLGVAVPKDAVTVMEAAGMHRIPMRFDCGGKGVCGKCRVIPEPAGALSPVTETERQVLSPEAAAMGCRLACQAVVRGHVRVTVPEALVDAAEVRGKDGVAGVYPARPFVSRVILPAAPLPEPVDGRSATLRSWMADRVRAETGRKVILTDPHALRQASLPDSFAGETTLVVHDTRGVTAVLPGRRPLSLGVALDLGTTTLAAYLCDMKRGRVLSAASAVNPQRRFGEDVISRIAHADQSESGLRQMQGMVASAVNALIERAAGAAGATVSDVDEVAAAGNTTMLQIFAGFHPGAVGAAPYLPAVREFPDFSAADLGLALHPGTNVHLLPVVSGFVGGDAMAAILADGPHHRKETSLIVDIGTNGELVLAAPSGLWAASCATGPALEGAQISCGMRAVSGAVYRVEPGPDGGVRCHVLGEEGVRPLGLCGSGVIDAVAVLRRQGVIEPPGRFHPGARGVVFDERGLGTRVVLVPEGDSGSGAEISLSLMDVRSLQLAKAALSVGIEFLMRQAGVDRVDRTLLTGAFGARFDWRNAALIGMLPEGAVAGTVEAEDNLAGVGAVMALVNRELREEILRVSRSVRFVELAGDPAFAMRFAQATRFPELGAVHDLSGGAPG